MKFVDISINRFGVLRETELQDLSRGMTVVYGTNGSGKTTLVSFLRGLLFGYTTDHQAFQEDDSRFGGAVTLESQGRSLRLTRECSHGVSSDLSAVDLGTGLTDTRNLAILPSWVHETVYREIFSVGYQEAARFDLLTRLCINDHESIANPDEIRRTELAIQQSVREREGNGHEGGLRKHIADLTRQRESLALQLTDMRKLDPELPERIRALEARLERLRDTRTLTERQIQELHSEIHRLEERLEILRRRNTVSLNRRAIEEQIARLEDKQNRWQQIQQSIQREFSVSGTRTATWKAGDSLQSIRAIVDRLEERMQTLADRGTLRSEQLSETNRELFFEHLQSEVFSLCELLTQHKSAVATQHESLEALFAQRSLHNIEQAEAVVQGQIDSLREELSRSEDVLAASLHSPRECSSSAHASYRQTAHVGSLSLTSIEEIETQLLALRRRLDDLNRNQQATSTEIRRLEFELNELRAQRKAVARLEDIDRVKAQLADLDAQLTMLKQRWQTLEQAEAHLRTVLERLTAVRPSRVLELASHYIDRLTDGDCQQLISDASESRILARTRQSSQPQQLAQLSHGTRNLVALALRLALIQCRAEDDERCPLILDDVFISADDDAATAAVDLLMEVASEGQQVIFFTCQKDVRQLFADRRAAVRHLGTVQRVVEPPVPTISIPTPAPQPQPIIAEPRPSDHTNWLFYLEVDNSVEDLSGLTVAEVEAFRHSGIQTIDELLSLSVDDLEQRFRNKGYSISRDRIRAWRGQAELATQIPMLRRSDAELLYAAGIQSTVELSRMRPETVFDVVSEFQNSSGGNRYRRSGRSIDRQQAINWSRWSQHARTLSDARRLRSRFFVQSDDRNDDPGSRDNHSGSRSSNVRQRRTRMSQTGTITRRQRRPRLSLEARRLRDQRLSRRRRRLEQHSSSYRTTTKDDATSEERQLRFYLNRSDDVEAAPSIGPKTAQRLSRIKIYTVDDLLAANAQDVARQLDNRRINAETILQWQQQARLVCQVPELRGHDAQILVACGITEPEQLSAKRPSDLFAVVGPFSETTEGERIIRSGKKPDLEEVTDWIRFAQNARPLKAAA